MRWGSRFLGEEPASGWCGKYCSAAGETVGHGYLDPVRPRLDLKGWGPISVGGYQEQEAGSDEDSERSQEGLEAGEDS